MTLKCDAKLEDFIKNANKQNPYHPCDMSKFFDFVYTEYSANGYVDIHRLQNILLDKHFPEIVVDNLIKDVECICIYEKWKAGKL